MIVKNAKLIVKDESGNIIQLLPEVKVDDVLNENSDFPIANKTVAIAIAGLNFFTPVALTETSINIASGNVFTKTISANTTFTISGVPQGKSTMFNLVLTNGGAYTVTWPASVKWSKGIPPALTSSGIDVLTFLTVDSGTTWYGTASVLGAA